MSDRVDRIVAELRQLTVAELAEVYRKLWEDPPDAGVREPVAPEPEPPLLQGREVDWRRLDHP